MNQSIKITEREGRQVVSARELHEALGLSKSNWVKWYKKNIINNLFASEHTDWVGFVLSTNGNETMDFALSIEFAKKLSITAPTEEGNKVRNYFLEVEKSAKQMHAALTSDELVNNPDLLIRLATKLKQESEEKIQLQYKAEALSLENEQKEKQLKIAAPKVEMYDAAMSTDSVMLIRNAAKLICDMGQNKLYQKLREDKYLMKNNEPYQKYVDAGLFEIKERVVPTSNVNIITSTTYVTQKGIAYLQQKYGKKKTQLIEFTN